MLSPCREFTVTGADPSDVYVSSLAWNSESDVLAVALRAHPSRTAEVTPDVLQLWHRNNYCWYKKWERIGVQVRLGRMMKPCVWAAMVGVVR